MNRHIVIVGMCAHIIPIDDNGVRTRPCRECVSLNTFTFRPYLRTQCMIGRAVVSEMTETIQWDWYGRRNEAHVAKWKVKCDQREWEIKERVFEQCENTFVHLQLSPPQSSPPIAHSITISRPQSNRSAIRWRWRQWRILIAIWFSLFWVRRLTQSIDWNTKSVQNYFVQNRIVVHHWKMPE